MTANIHTINQATINYDCCISNQIVMQFLFCFVWTNTHSIIIEVQSLNNKHTETHFKVEIKVVPMKHSNRLCCSVLFVYVLNALKILKPKRHDNKGVLSWFLPLYVSHRNSHFYSNDYSFWVVVIFFNIEWWLSEGTILIKQIYYQ